MSDRLFALRLFTRVARKGSFSAAARELNFPQSTASRTIATLEREIGVALFVRTTRAVTLTDAGLDFLARIEAILTELDEAEYAARGTGRLHGVLRIGVGTNFRTWRANSAVPGLGRWDGRTQRRLCQRQSRQAFGALTHPLIGGLNVRGNKRIR
jgi:DNA-binding transcriptional LysR family regulator